MTISILLESISSSFYTRWLIIIFLLVGINDSVYSQKSEIGNWFIYFGNQKINKNWNWHNEIQYRNYDFIGDTNQLLLRTGIGYNLTENNNNVLLGYAFVNTQKYIPNSDQKQESNEHRIFQQFITKQNFGRFYFLHIYRIEERFLTDDFQMRLRYFLNLNIPLNKIKVEYQILRRKLPEDSAFPIPHVSKHIPAHGAPSVTKVYDEFMTFIHTVFDDEGKFRDIEFPKVPGPAKKNCKFCEFGNRGICDKKATK